MFRKVLPGFFYYIIYHVTVTRIINIFDLYWHFISCLLLYGKFILLFKNGLKRPGNIYCLWFIVRSHGTPLCRFWVRGRWRGGDADELRTFLCIALPSGDYPIAPIPVRLGKVPLRRAIALRDVNNQSVSDLINLTYKLCASCAGLAFRCVLRFLKYH